MKLYCWELNFAILPIGGDRSILDYYRDIHESAVRPRSSGDGTRVVWNGCSIFSYFFGGAFLSNAIPHFVSGAMGHPFQSPFATPSGEGLSSSTVNVFWGFANLAIAYLLICRVGDFNLRSMADVAAVGLGFLLMGLIGARHFGRFHGGNL